MSQLIMYWYRIGIAVILEQLRREIIFLHGLQIFEIADQPNYCRGGSITRKESYL
jgi:hypothetical protein